jgi:hypothetical protein
MSLIFIYTTALNIGERPEGIKIASFFILAMMVSSLTSRALRSTELRISGVDLDSKARELLQDDEDMVIRLIARKPKLETEQELDQVDRKVRECHSISPDECVIFFEVEPGDASEFEKHLHVTGERVGKHRILRAKSPVVANAFAALLINLEKTTGRVPHAYFNWHEGNPIASLFAFLFFGEGDAAPLAHEVLRRAIEDPEHRPIIHVS